jgi:hypothetical protein
LWRFLDTFLRCIYTSVQGFVESGTLNFPDLDGSYKYSYSIADETINLRTFLELSLSTKDLFVEEDTTDNDDTIFKKIRRVFWT